MIGHFREGVHGKCYEDYLKENGAEYVGTEYSRANFNSFTVTFKYEGKLYRARGYHNRLFSATQITVDFLWAKEVE